MTEKPRVALVTGASAGIGLACADLLHAAGWTVIGASRRGTGGAPGTAPGSTAARPATPVTPADARPAAVAGSWTGPVMDVDDDDSARDGIQGIIAAYGRIDAIVAAAGWGVAGPVELTAVTEAKAQLETNFWGCVRVVQAALPAMRAQGGERIGLLAKRVLPFRIFEAAVRSSLGVS
jgi:NAD(P)-dependent dehydrogenase (short-subunit alcohol dehydrogenase family)